MIKKIARALLTERQRNELLIFLSQLKSLAYTGDTFYCNCCNKTFSKFLPYGNQPRTNARCPWCLSLERTRLLLCYLERETSVFPPGKKILHFAPERMIRKKIRQKARRGDYIAADLNPALGDMVVDITKIPFPEEYFDYIICSHVLGHVPDEAKAIDEMYRVLKPGGEALVMTVIDLSNPATYENRDVTTPEERLVHYGEPDLVRLHGTDFGRRLQRANAQVEEIDYSLRLTEAERRRLSTGNRERELIFRCVKTTL